jgi:hypothetical protein
VCCCCSLSLAGVCCCCFHIGWGMLLLLSHWLGCAAAALSLAGVCCCCFHIGWGMLLLLSHWLGYAAAALSLAGVCCCCFDIGWGMLLLLSHWLGYAVAALRLSFSSLSLCSLFVLSCFSRFTSSLALRRFCFSALSGLCYLRAIYTNISAKHIYGVPTSISVPTNLSFLPVSAKQRHSISTVCPPA